MAAGRYRLGIDIGGTFTDLALLDARSGSLALGKTLTTPDDPAAGALHGLRRLLARDGIDPTGVEWTVHATTLITNALIERTGARTGLITTVGFRDVLAIGRELRYDLYDLFQERPAPLVEGRHRREVGERLAADGTVRRPLGAVEVRRALRELVADGVESVAIVFLHAYGNDAHERAAAEIAAAEYPQLFVSRSSRVAPEIREYERASTTAANAYVGPLAARYVARLEERLGALGVGGPLYLMVSAGGITSAAAARERPIALTESGPAAGALVGGYYGALAGERNVLAFDMGGTTAKLCLIDDGRPLLSYGFEVGRVHRFKKGSGLPLRVPAIDLIEIGAGGGSIARIDRLGLLKVGPDSAGAAPGPAAYGRGGSEPTVTDADLLLGYLNPDYFLGGEMRLDVAAARAALAERLAGPLGRDVTAVAWGVHDIVNEQMGSAARIHVAERGRDPRRSALVATGGAGPVHACRLARKLGVGRVLCPLGAGVASTVGLLVAPPRVDLVHAAVARLDELDWEGLEASYAAMRAEATALLGRLGAAPEDIAFAPLADLRYVGQGFEVVTPLPAGPYGPGSREGFTAAFEAAYRALYRRVVPGAAVEGLHWRLRASGPASGAEQVAAALRARGAAGGAADGDSRRGERPAYFPELGGFVVTPVHDRYRLWPGDQLRGPAIVEERESTVVLPPGTTARVEPALTLVIDLEGGDGGA